MRGVLLAGDTSLAFGGLLARSLELDRISIAEPALRSSGVDAGGLDVLENELAVKKDGLDTGGVRAAVAASEAWKKRLSLAGVLAFCR